MITDYIPIGRENAVTRKFLIAMTGLGDREIRDNIAEARRNTPIINLSDGNGYFIPDVTKPSEIEDLRAYIKQEESRARQIFWSLKGARQMLKEVEKNESTMHKGL